MAMLNSFRNWKRDASFILVIGFLLFAFSFSNKIYHEAESIQDVREVIIGGTVLKVELALTPLEQEKGLGGKDSMAPDTGMLFVLPDFGRNYFWMKDMKFPIDIIWLDQGAKVIYIENNLAPSSYPNTFGPDENSKYVLEVNAGFAKTHNLQVGDPIKFK
jgi:uncharacterized membrane protein (UPF0127 family)